MIQPSSVLPVALNARWVPRNGGLPQSFRIQLEHLDDGYWFASHELSDGRLIRTHSTSRTAAITQCAMACARALQESN